MVGTRVITYCLYKKSRFQQCSYTDAGTPKQGDKGGQRKVPSITKSDLIVTNIAITVQKSALLVNKSALSVQKKVPFQSKKVLFQSKKCLLSPNSAFQSKKCNLPVFTWFGEEERRRDEYYIQLFICK